MATPHRRDAHDAGHGASLGSGSGGGLTVRARGPFAALDELRDAPAALAAELRVALAPELALPRLTTAPTELRVALAPELTLACLTALASEIRVAARAELLLASLATAPADLGFKTQPKN